MGVGGSKLKMSGNWLKMSGSWWEWMWVDGSGWEHVLQIFLLIAPPFAGLSKVRYVLVNVYYVLFSFSNQVCLCLKIGYQFIDSRFKSKVNCLRFTDLICRHKSYLQTSCNKFWQTWQVKWFWKRGKEWLTSQYFWH